MEWVEVTGRTVEEAKEAALEQLGVAEGDAEVIVLAEPRAGLFGRMRGEARVRARVRPVGPRPKRTRRPRERPRSGRNGQRGDAKAEEGRPTSRRARGGASTTVDVGDGATTGGHDPDRSSGGTGRSRSARRRRSRRGDRPAQTAENARDASQRDASTGTESSNTKEEIGMAEGMTLQEQAEVARDFLHGLMAQFNLDATVNTRVVDEETVEVAATGDDLGILVGPRGTTLAALQDLTRTVVQRQFPSKTDRILVDVAGYRERRVAALQRFSNQIAEEVLSSGTERALEPMSPADRKVVHDTVNTIEGVSTRSVGEEPSRYIVIAPGA